VAVAWTLQTPCDYAAIVGGRSEAVCRSGAGAPLQLSEEEYTGSTHLRSQPGLKTICLNQQNAPAEAGILLSKEGLSTMRTKSGTIMAACSGATCHSCGHAGYMEGRRNALTRTPHCLREPILSQGMSTQRRMCMHHCAGFPGGRGPQLEFLAANQPFQHDIARSGTSPTVHGAVHALPGNPRESH